MLLVKNATHLGAPVDLLVNHDHIMTMTPHGHCHHAHATEIFDANGLALLPALIDCHVHLREPGQEYKEDIKTGLAAAARGGFGAVMCMANTKPVNDNASVTTFMLEKAREARQARLYPIAAATIGLKGEEMAPLGELKDAGCVAVSNDGKPMVNSELVRRVMEYASDLGMIFIDHCEDPFLAKGWLMHEGEVSGRLGVKGQPGSGEAIQAARDIALAECLNLPVHIAHVSSKFTVEEIRRGKERGVQVTAETCPHYLLLTHEALDGYNTLAKVSPPLRESEDRQVLREAVKTGIIDILATDHAPHAALEKNDTLDRAPFGISGLDLALALSFRLVEEGVLREVDLHRLWATRPGEIFNLPHNGFAPGDPADFMLFDPHEQWRATPEAMVSKSANTPFINEEMKGRVKFLWLKGERVF